MYLKRGMFFIVSRDAQRLADFCLAAQQRGLICQVRDKSCQCRGKEEAKAQAADILTGLCFSVWEQRWLADLACRRYECFNRKEQGILLNKAICLTNEDNFCWGLFAGGEREKRLRAALLEQLQRCPVLDIEGFWRFRMEGYREYLQTLLSIAADEVLWEQEDADYLRLLAEYMAARPPGGEVHVFLLRKGCYDICLKAQDGLRFVEGGRLHGCEDLFLYTLLHLAPQRLYVHHEQALPHSLHQLLCHLFGARLQWESVV